mmetsp:Transcript_21216/g.74825  ORF Transcript_21216/g.74825 Transcript_21216/m.74825 type:complete len:292 (-) Transcript_21216:269-1144(-)
MSVALMNVGTSIALAASITAAARAAGAAPSAAVSILAGSIWLSTRTYTSPSLRSPPKLPTRRSLPDALRWKLSQRSRICSGGSASMSLSSSSSSSSRTSSGAFLSEMADSSCTLTTCQMTPRARCSRCSSTHLTRSLACTLTTVQPIALAALIARLQFSLTSHGFSARLVGKLSARSSTVSGTAALISLHSRMPSLSEPHSPSVAGSVDMGSTPVEVRCSSRRRHWLMCSVKAMASSSLYEWCPVWPLTVRMVACLASAAASLPLSAPAFLKSAWMWQNSWKSITPSPLSS